MKKTNKIIIGGIAVTSLAASIIGGCYKFEPEKNVVPCLYATPQSIMEEKIKEAQEVMEREEREKQQEQEQKQQGQPKTETKK